MTSRSLLLVLLVLSCLQSFTTAHNTKAPKKCCFRHQTQPINIKHITGYNETAHQCTKPGVIFTLKDGRQLCADPGVKWVQSIMKNLKI